MRYWSRAYTVMKTFLSSTILLLLRLTCLVRTRSPIFFWIMLELNLMFVLFLMFENIASVKAIVCYFIFQIYGSLLFICGFIRYDLIFISFIGLAIKFGLFPFHIWQPFVFNFLNWKICFVVAGPQKAFIILLFLFFNFKINYFVVGVIIFTILITNLYLIFLYDLKKTFAFLSIRRSSWLLFAISLSIEQNIWFLFLYNIQIVLMFTIFHFSETLLLDRKKYLNLLILIFIIRYSGIPPIIGFFMKLQILNFFFFLYQRVFFIVVITIVIIPSTFFIVYYRIRIFLKKKIITLQNVSLFFTSFIAIIFLLPSFIILL